MGGQVSDLDWKKGLAEDSGRMYDQLEAAFDSGFSDFSII
jgi:hypothetical protein